MKTKHLFLATALMASFAACTNEEIVSDVQQNVATGRPTVENVKLTFGENVDSRLVYNKGYKWESTDVIGALLMDQPCALPSAANWGDLTWLQRYELTNTIHTSYPFTYDTEDETWGTPAKMLEGNYFFAFPWESYDGNRQVAHSLIAQEQTGVDADVRAESYANNQFFIGYDRIIAGTQAEEALNNVTMTPVLGAIQLQIVNTGTQDYHINKVVLKGEDLSSVLTFDPISAEYGEYNLEKANSVLTPKHSTNWGTYFNYANYLGCKEDLVAYTNATKNVYNADKTYSTGVKQYNKEDALLAVVKPLSSDNDGFSQLYIKGTEEERLLEAGAGNTAYVLIMATPDDEIEAGELTLDVYTDEGVVLGVDLTKINKEIKEGKSTAITSAKVKAIGPDVVNTIKVQIDDNSFNVPTTMNVYNDNDLLQFLQWNANEPGAREIYAILKKDVTLTAEMIETLAINKSIDLFIAGGHEITLDAELDSDILDAENLYVGEVKESEVKEDLDGDNKTTTTFSAPAIKVLGEIELTQTANNVGKITVAEGAELTIDDKKVKSVKVDNYGTLTIGAATKYLATGPINNYGEMTVAEEAIVKAAINNYNELTIEGKATAVTNEEDATIALGEEANLTLSGNEGLVETEDGAVVKGDNTNGEIEYVEGAEIDLSSGKEGIVYREVEGEVEAEPTGTAAVGVTAWYVVGDIEVTEDATIGYVKVMGNYDIEVAAPAAGARTLTITEELVINGGTATEGNIVAKQVIVNEEGIWTNNGSVAGVASISNEKGEIENNGTIVMEAGTTGNFKPAGAATNTHYIAGEWDGDPASIANAAAATKQEVMDAAVAAWAGAWEAWIDANLNSTYFENKDPYNFKSFIAAMNAGGNTLENPVKTWADHKDALVKVYYGTTDAKKNEADAKMFSKDNCLDFEPAEFKTAIEKVLKGKDNVNLNAAKAALIDSDDSNIPNGQFINITLSAQTTVFKNMEAVRNYIAGVAMNSETYLTEAGSFNKGMGAWVISTSDIESAIEATQEAKNVAHYFMLESDDIVAVARMWEEYDELFNVGWNFNVANTGNQVVRLQSWFDAVYNTSKATWSDKQNDAWAAVKAYQSFIEGLEANEYTDEQVIAAGQPASN